MLAYKNIIYVAPILVYKGLGYPVPLLAYRAGNSDTQSHSVFVKTWELGHLALYTVTIALIPTGSNTRVHRAVSSNNKLQCLAMEAGYCGCPSDRAHRVVVGGIHNRNNSTYVPVTIFYT